MKDIVLSASLEDYHEAIFHIMRETKAGRAKDISETTSGIRVREHTVSSILPVGQPNVGKRVLFSHITGVRTVASNYPGTTVSYAAWFALLCAGNHSYTHFRK